MMAGRPLRVAIVGASMSGKSTLAAQLAAHYGTVWVPEYLREFVDARGLPQAGDQAGIARVQLAREAAALAGARGFLFCDTAPLMTAVYSRFYFGGIDPELERLVQVHTYDHTLLCAPDWGWVPDGLHREARDVSGPVTEVLRDELDKRNIRYTLVAGDSARRLMKVEQLLGKPVTVGK